MAAGWPWPRDVYAMLIDRLMEAGASVVALDILFPTPRDGDPALKAVLDKYRDRVVIGSNFADEPIPARPAHTPSRPRPHPQPRTKMTASVIVNFWPDTDGVIRTVKYRMTQSGGISDRRQRPGLYSLGRPRSCKNQACFPPCPPPFAAFISPPPRGRTAFQPIPLYTLFLPDAWKDNFKNGAFFKDKIVVVGPFGNSLKDQVPTPFGLMDGPELHLNAINDALHGRLRLNPPGNRVLLLIIAMGLAAFVARHLPSSPPVTCLHPRGVSAAYLGLFSLGIDVFHRVIPFLAPLLTFDAGSVLALYWKWLLERRERSRMRRMFERFVSKNVVKEVVENRAELPPSIGRRPQARCRHYDRPPRLHHPHRAGRSHPASRPTQRILHRHGSLHLRHQWHRR